MKYAYFLFIIFLSTSVLKAKEKDFASQEQLKAIQIKTIEIHNNIIQTQKSISNLEIEIKKNKQSQLIFNKYINDEENLAENIILLLNKKMIKSPEQKFLKNLIKGENNLLGDKIIMTFILEAIKNDINIFLERIDKSEVLNLQLNDKISILNTEISKLENSKIKLAQELKKKRKLQKKNPKSVIFAKKQKKIKNKVKNINELVTGVSSAKKKKDVDFKSKKIIFPINGNIISNFKQVNDNANYVNGLTFESNDDPYIVSPLNGVIVFAGKFRSYGNLIIIENKNEYHSILAGMDEILTYSGSEVLIGEPIAKNHLNNKKKRLYFELRFKGKPVDPKREVEIL